MAAAPSSAQLPLVLQRAGNGAATGPGSETATGLATSWPRAERPGNAGPQGRASEHRDGAEALGGQLAGQLMGQLSRQEARLLHGLATAAIEDRDALGSGDLEPSRIAVQHQLTDRTGQRS